MARRRNFSAEAARRNELARERGQKGYYEIRIARARRKYPGISKAAARGHGTPDEKAAMRLISLVPELNPDTMIAFTGTDRQPDATWRVGRFDILTDDRGDLVFKIGPSGLYLLPNVARAIRDSGWANLGAKYLSLMADNGIKLRDNQPVSNPRGPVFADGVQVGDGIDEQGRGIRRKLEKSMSKWRRVE